MGGNLGYICLKSTCKIRSKVAEVGCSLVLDSVAREGRHTKAEAEAEAARYRQNHTPSAAMRPDAVDYVGLTVLGKLCSTVFISMYNKRLFHRH